MEFLEALLLKHQNYYKQNKIGDHLKLRTPSFKAEYKQKLFLKMDETRNLEALTPINAKEKSNGRIDRLTKLKMWKQEKEKQKQQVSKKPVFIVAARKNVGIPALKTEAARKKNLAVPQKHITEKKDDESVFDGGFFVIRTPSKIRPLIKDHLQKKEDIPEDQL